MATSLEAELSAQRAKLKEWEHQFEATRNRKPTKDEIRKIPEICSISDEMYVKYIALSKKVKSQPEVNALEKPLEQDIMDLNPVFATVFGDALPSRSLTSSTAVDPIKEDKSKPKKASSLRDRLRLSTGASPAEVQRVTNRTRSEPSLRVPPESARISVVSKPAVVVKPLSKKQPRKSKALWERDVTPFAGDSNTPAEILTTVNGTIEPVTIAFEERFVPPLLFLSRFDDSESDSDENDSEEDYPLDQGRAHHFVNTPLELSTNAKRKFESDIESSKPTKRQRIRIDDSQEVGSSLVTEESSKSKRRTSQISSGSASAASSASSRAANKRGAKRSKPADGANYLKLNLPKGYKAPGAIRTANGWRNARRAGSEVRQPPNESPVDLDVSDRLDDDLVAELIEHTRSSDELQSKSLPSIALPPHELEDYLRALSQAFGLQSLRSGQKETMDRILNGQSCLTIMPTGSGKSLCYQLPAFIYKSCAGNVRPLVIVISPLIALIQDQIKQLPSSLVGGTVNSQQSKSAMTASLAELTSGGIDILYLSPEKLAHAEFRKFLLSLKRPIPFACVDEAHCVSQWSHNFRPSYLDIYSNLIALGVSTILALTATATKKTQHSICQLLSIPESNVVSTDIVRSNLTLTVSMDANRMNSIVQLLRAQPYSNFNRILVYVHLQRHADDLASHLLACGFDSVMSYHAGKSPKDRLRISESWFEAKCRILVATIAFGMGVNVDDVGAVIHFHLPSSLEAYVQETGRAGRNGLPARCHAFVEEGDIHALQSHAFSDEVDRVTVKALIARVFSYESVALNGSYQTSISWVLSTG